MDNLRQTGKTLRKAHEEGDLNIRRERENYPDIHRSVDSVNPVFGYNFEFPTTAHPHKVSLNLFVHETKPCEIDAPEIFVAATGQCGPFPGATEGGGMEVYIPAGQTQPGLVSNIGGFVASPGGGIIVPLSGYYNIHFTNAIGGVNVLDGSFILAEIRANGATLATQVFSSGHGYTQPLAGIGVGVDLWAVGIFIPEGGIVGGWLSVNGIAFFTPSNLCFFPTDSTTTITLVGLP